MNTAQHIAQHLDQVYFGGNWTASSLEEQLKGVSWQQATTAVGDTNSIATLVFHIQYYIHAVLGVLVGEPLQAKDADSFAHPPIESQKDWEQFLQRNFQETKRFIKAIETLDPSLMETIFVEEKYGTYYRNLQGIVEHTHYHLGQIVLLKKLL